MKTQHFIKKAKESDDFKNFMKEDSSAYLCSLFFTRDYETKQNETQVDFYSPKKNVIVSFKVDKKVERIPLDKKAETITHQKFIPKPLGEKIKMNIEDVKPVLMDEMNNRSMASDINKILVVLHIADDRIVWNCTGFLKGLGLLQAHLEDSSESVLFMEKKNFMDLLKFVKKVEPGELGKKDSKDKKKVVKKGFRAKKK
ncbi:hypothetical protein HY212_05830 [Candidatus Pacearchaeota archaeon]|nr:hypothetical protein [Candidatus Pacearchaeota archaeon]